jgi:hypothetical protein
MNNMNTSFKKLSALSLFVALLLPSASAFAVGNEATEEQDFSEFQSYYEVDFPALVTPEVISVELYQRENKGFAVLEKDTGRIEGYGVFELVEEESSLRGGKSSAVLDNKAWLFDGKYNRSLEFDLDADEGSAFIEVLANDAFETNSIHLELDQYVAVPHRVAVSAMVGNSWKTVLAERENYSSLLTFPATTSDQWRVEMKHSQPLRLLELDFDQEEYELPVIEVRWLARPGMTYRLYAEPRNYTSVGKKETGKLSGEDLDVAQGMVLEKMENPVFIEPDSDGDGVPDIKDNCVRLENKDQADINNNAIGDACEDYDGDYVLNINDNCPEHVNRNQRDEDGDGIGDECDGEESRITEQNPWLPWMAMGLVFLVVIALVVKTMKSKEE